MLPIMYSGVRAIAIIVRGRSGRHAAWQNYVNQAYQPV